MGSRLTDGRWVALRHTSAADTIEVGTLDPRPRGPSQIKVRETLAHLLHVEGAQTREQVMAADATGRHAAAGAWERITLTIDGRPHRAEGIAVGTRWIGYTLVDGICIYVHARSTSPARIRIERITEPRRYADVQASPGSPPR